MARGKDEPEVIPQFLAIIFAIVGFAIGLSISLGACWLVYTYWFK